MLLLKNAYFLNKKLIVVITFILYSLFLCFSLFYYNHETLKVVLTEKTKHKGLFKTHRNVEQEINPTVHIIGKAAIGQYLWLHIFNGTLDFIGNGFFQNGNKTINKIIFNYLSGPGYIQNSIPDDIQYLVLILNGRTSKHIFKARQWLDFLPEIKSLEKIALIMLGNEQCENQWILQYMKSKGGIIDTLFLVYDSALIDNKEVFQWPLGVATYRGFPNLPLKEIKHISSPRKYKCNFMGTVYKNSSREIVNEILRNSEFKNMCYLSGRDKWVPEESEESLTQYLSVLQNSDFTLNPVGENTECYRIYEAITVGSIPIIEDNMTPGVCVSPLRLLKSFNPPFIFLKNWKTLHYLLQQHENLDFRKLIERRKKLIVWYEEFKKNIATYFINILKESFFKR